MCSKNSKILKKPEKLLNDYYAKTPLEIFNSY